MTLIRLRSPLMNRAIVMRANPCFLAHDETSSPRALMCCRNRAAPFGVSTLRLVRSNRSAVKEREFFIVTERMEPQASEMPETTGDLVRQLREVLELTQEELGKRCGYAANPRAYVGKIETGHNKLSSAYGRDGLARGFGLTREQLESYLDGRASLAETVARARGEASDDPPSIEERSGHEVRDDEDAFGAALLWALDRERHTVRDLDAVRGALRNIARMAEPDADLVAAARARLDAAARLRRAGKPVTVDSLLLAVTLGEKTAAVSASSKALQADTEREWSERSKKT